MKVIMRIQNISISRKNLPNKARERVRASGRSSPRMGLHKSLASAQSPHEKERLERQIKSTDVGIDKLVYELYGLSEEEIAIVEQR